MFLDTETAQCNDDARAAIREAFHDCGTWNKAQGNTGGCDGSLILAPETDQPENNGLRDTSAKLLALAKKRGVGVALSPLSSPDLLTYTLHEKERYNTK